jgi:hypothetical protein
MIRWQTQAEDSMGESLDAKTAWVHRVLGVAATAAPPASADTRRPLEIWREAKETVDDGVSALQKACLAEKNPALTSILKEVVDKGLNGVTDRASVGMLAAMMEAESSPAARAKAMKAVDNFQVFLATPGASMIDNNPFGVTINLRRTFGDALQTIKTRLAS